MRRRDLTIGLLLAPAIRTVWAQPVPKQHRIAIVISIGRVASIDNPANRFWRPFFEELRRLGDVEGRNLVVERYSGEGRTESFPDLARAVADRNPDVIVTDHSLAPAVRAATATIPIVWIGVEPIGLGFASSLARPGGNVTGVSLHDMEMNGKRLQILKDAAPSASRIAWLTMRASWEGSAGAFQPVLQESSRRLQISVIPMLLRESIPSEYQRVFAEIVQQRPDAIIVSDISELFPYRHLIVELAEQNRLPGIYPYRDYAEAGGLMAYGSDLAELWRRIADDLHQVLNGAKPSDIPIYQPIKFELLINLKAAQVLGLTIPPSLPPGPTR